MTANHDSFRVYDRELAHYSKDSFLLDEDGDLYQWEFCPDSEPLSIRSHSKDGDRLLVERSTGLTDSRGREIFNKDVVDHPLFGVFVVNWYHGRYQLVVLERRQMSMTKKHMWIGKTWAKKCTVTGTIHDTEEE